jgi:hypothetical protein
MLQELRETGTVTRLAPGLSCSLCGADGSARQFMFAGSGLFICDHCLDRAREELEATSDQADKETTTGSEATCERW